jgi:hypothetical protein
MKVARSVGVRGFFFACVSTAELQTTERAGWPSCTVEVKRASEYFRIGDAAGKFLIHAHSRQFMSGEKLRD